MRIAANESRERWAGAWRTALGAWSRHLLLRAPQLCLTDQEAAREGLTESFAMIRLVDQAVIINLADIERRGLAEYAVEILAHEIGHHVLAPATLTDHARALARIRRALPTLEAHAPMVANLYTDLLINDRLQRSANLRLAELFARVGNGTAGDSSLWRLYLRIYELLWSLPRGDLAGDRLDDAAEGDAWLAMRIVRHYARRWLDGSDKFAMLLLPYLAKDAGSGDAARAWHDTRSAAAQGEPAGLAEEDENETAPLIHPSQDPELTGAEAADVAGGKQAPSEPVAPAAGSSTGQGRQPFEYGEILRAAGVVATDHDLAVRYYREKAAPHVVPFPARRRPRSADPLPEGLEPWSVGESLDSIDWLQTILQSPHVIPGMTTVQRVWGVAEGTDAARMPLNLDVYIDSSGSMPNPQQLLSFPTLAGAILCLSALRAGASVQVTVWSGKEQVTSTPGFIRDTQQVLRTLTSFYGGGTQFPLPTLRETYDRQSGSRPTHLMMISDDGITTIFDRDERGNEGWDVLQAALTKARGGATFVLNLPKGWETASNAFYKRELLIRAGSELDIDIYRIDDWPELVKFAGEFARRTYALNERAPLAELPL
jgi:hypothetical protein